MEVAEAALRCHLPTMALMYTELHSASSGGGGGGVVEEEEGEEEESLDFDDFEDDVSDNDRLTFQCHRALPGTTTTTVVVVVFVVDTFLILATPATATTPPTTTVVVVVFVVDTFLILATTATPATPTTPPTPTPPPLHSLFRSGWHLRRGPWE